jgi:nitric oxide reductase subunit B
MKKYWLILMVVLIGAFTLLGFYGSEIYRQAPPLFAALKTNDGKTILTKEDILDGQVIWQSIGGQEIGSIWGHGAYQAPDWTADWLHRELVNYQELYAQQNLKKSFAQTSETEKMIIKSSLLKDYREARPVNDIVTFSAIRFEAYTLTKNYYVDLFSDSSKMKSTRIAYAIADDVLPELQKREKMMAFFFWSTWAASTKYNLHQQLAT